MSEPYALTSIASRAMSAAHGARPSMLLVLLLALTASVPTNAATFVVNNRFDSGTGGCTVSECTLRGGRVAGVGDRDDGGGAFRRECVCGESDVSH